MTRAFPRAAVSAIPVVVALPDPDDVHVVGTALAAAAPLIVTYNLSDFPAESIANLGLRAVHPDALTNDLLGREPEAESKYDELLVRASTGLGSEKATTH